MKTMMIFWNNLVLIRTKQSLKLKDSLVESSTDLKKIHKRYPRSQFRIMFCNQIFQNWQPKVQLISSVNLVNRNSQNQNRLAKPVQVVWIKIRTIVCQNHQPKLIPELEVQDKTSFKRQSQETQIGMRVLKVSSSRTCLLVNSNMLLKLH